jgi:hypothetical protein
VERGILVVSTLDSASFVRKDIAGPNLGYRIGQNKRERGGRPVLEPHTAGRCEGPPVGDLSVDSFLSRCLLFDLEVGRGFGEVVEFVEL